MSPLSAKPGVGACNVCIPIPEFNKNKQSHRKNPKEAF
jgi:hypothetical protein